MKNFTRLLFPGPEYPFTRGIHAEMYTKGKFPTVRKYGGFGSGEDLNQHLRSQKNLDNDTPSLYMASKRFNNERFRGAGI